MSRLPVVAWRQRRTPDQMVFIIGLGVALSLLGDLTLYIVLPTHTQDAGIVLANVGLMLSANRLIRIVLNGPIGLLIERVPRRRIAVPALFLGGFSSLLYAVPGFWSLLIGRLLWGIAWAGVWLSASTMVLDLSREANRGRLVGRLQMWYFIGCGAGSFLGGALTDGFGYVSTFLICAVVTLSSAIVWLLLLPETRPATPRQVAPAPDTAVLAPPIDFVSARMARSLITAVLLLGLNWLVFLGVLGAVLPLLLEDRFGETARVAGLLIPLATFTGILSGASQVVSLVASPLTGWLSDLLQQRWGLVLGALVLGIGSTSLLAVGSGTVIVIAVLISAVATSGLQTQVMTLVGDQTLPHQRGRILGILNTVGDLGSAGGPLLAYALLESFELDGIFWASTALLALVLPWTLWIARQEAAARRAAPAASML